jgi:hypothetical protein
LAKTIQSLATPELYNDVANLVNDVVIKHTLFMPPGLHELLVRMTGEDGYERPELNRVPVFTPEEVQKRKDQLASRPSAAQVLVELNKIDSEWRR